MVDLLVAVDEKLLVIPVARILVGLLVLLGIDHVLVAHIEDHILVVQPKDHILVILLVDIHPFPVEVVFQQIDVVVVVIIPQIDIVVVVINPEMYFVYLVVALVRSLDH